MTRKKVKRYTKEELEQMFGSEKPKKKFENPRKCSDCGSEDIDYRAGEYFCKKCGYVLENI